MSFECGSFSGEKYFHPNLNELVKASSCLWRQYNIKCLSTWVTKVHDYFKDVEDKTHVHCLLALSSCPMLISSTNGLRVIVCVGNDHHLMPSCLADLLQKSNTLCGYNEEFMMCTLLQMYYENCMDRLVHDVNIAYSSLTAIGRLCHSIRYLHDRVCKSSRLPPFIELTMQLPYHYALQDIVLQLVHFVQRASSLRKSDLLTHMLVKPLHLTTDIEWETVKKCREICNLQWHPRYNREVTMIYGNQKWTTDWNTTYVKKADGTCFQERWEERLTWVSMWFALVSSGYFRFTDSPKLLLVRLAMLVS